MRFVLVVVLLILISPVLPDRCEVRGQAPEGPVVEGWEPKSGSIDSIIYLTGYRLGEWTNTKVFFIQNGVELPARTAGGWSTTNNERNGPQALGVIVPEEAVLGQAQIVVESNGRRSIPVRITITEWKLPVIHRLNPSRGAPGTLVRIEGEGFHVSDKIEIADANGKPINFNSGISSDGTVVGIPNDAPEGVVTVRVGNNKNGKALYTEPVTFTVTNEPLTVEVLASDTKSVAPGQWLDLQISNSKPLARSELTEVSFKQAGKTIIVAAAKPFRPRFAVPSSLSAGEVQLQLRTWRDGRPSEWSEPASFELADKPVAPMIDSIRLVKGSWASLSPGPERKTSFTVSPGDEVVLNGLWPGADPGKLKVLLVRAGEVITMTATEFDEKSMWFADIRVRLPESLGVGEWRMIVRSETDGTQAEVPIVIRVAN